MRLGSPPHRRLVSLIRRAELHRNPRASLAGNRKPDDLDHNLSKNADTIMVRDRRLAGQ